MTRLLSSLVAALALVGCGPSDTDAASSEVAGCGSRVGDAVFAATKDAPSTIEVTRSTANRVVGGPYIDGAAIEYAMVQLVAGAKHEVLVEFFDIEVGSWLATKLRDAIHALPSDVKVFVLVNPDEGVRLGGRYPEAASKAVGRVRDFFDDDKVTAGAWNHAVLWNMLEVLHDKLIVVDGARALVTDANLQRNSDPRAHGGKEWQQLGMTVEGPIASELREEVASAWHHATPKVTLPKAPHVHTVANACTPMIALTRREGSGESSAADRGFAAMFRSARHTVNVMTPNLNDDHALDALADATKTADVNIVLSKGFNDATESDLDQGGTNAHNVGRLAKAAANPCNLHIRWYAASHDVAVDGNVDFASHAKWASVDGLAMILGSQNLDTQSWKRSRETSIFVDDASTTTGFDAHFEMVWIRSPVAFECP